MGETRTIAEGQWLGSGNQIRSMRHLKTWGWVVKDSTGAEYAQRAPAYGLPMRVIARAGLRTFDVPTDGRTAVPLALWPAAPSPVEDQ